MYAKDGGLPANFATATVRITVLDENDNEPTFGSSYYNLEVPENQDPVELFTLRATDQDAGANGKIKYWITGTSRVTHTMPWQIPTLDLSIA